MGTSIFSRNVTVSAYVPCTFTFKSPVPVHHSTNSSHLLFSIRLASWSIPIIPRDFPRLTHITTSGEVPRKRTGLSSREVFCRGWEIFGPRYGGNERWVGEWCYRYEAASSIHHLQFQVRIPRIPCNDPPSSIGPPPNNPHPVGFVTAPNADFIPLKPLCSSPSTPLPSREHLGL